MRNFINRLRFWHYLVGVLVLAGIILTGTHFLGDGYTSLAMKKGIAHFSFEYPEQYKGYWWSKFYGWRNAPDAVYDAIKVMLIGRSHRSTLPQRPYISIYVSPSEPYYTGAKDIAKRRLGVRNDPNFQLLGENPVTISGEEGYKVVYVHTPAFYGTPFPIGQAPPPPPPEATPGVMREVFFISGDLLWEIRMFSPQDIAEATEAEFDHILQTFKILD